MFAQGFQTAGILGLSGQETLIILGVAVLLFGGKKIPELAKGMGEGIKNFKLAMKEEESSREEGRPREEGRARRGQEVEAGVRFTRCQQFGRPPLRKHQSDRNTPRTPQWPLRSLDFTGVRWTPPPRRSRMKLEGARNAYAELSDC